MTARPRILFFGYSEVGHECLELLLARGDNVVALINVRLAGRAAARKRYMRATLANGGSGNGDSVVIALLRKHATPVVNSPVAVLV